jgi:hypothetical protein
VASQQSNPNARPSNDGAPAPAQPLLCEDLLEAGQRLLDALGEEHYNHPPLTVTVEGGMMQVRIRRRRGTERLGR